MPQSTRLARAKLGVVLVLLIALSLALLGMSTPRRSASRTWHTWAWEVRYRLFPVHGKSQLAEVHLNASSSSREQCVACHGDKTSSKLLVHDIHLRSDLLPNLACPDCHRRVDLARRGKTGAGVWVDVGFCKKCHSAYPGGRTGSHMRANDLNADCTMCHTGARAIKHAQPYLSQIIPASRCRGCHGGRVLPWTPRHEQADWLQTHGKEALHDGTDRCFACHDFGLKFCDDCHGKKPASHYPVARWRAVHATAARTESRACAACHRTAFCQKCHVNHENGWMQTHPAFVDQHGTTSCTECHSASWCSYCHTSGSSATRPEPAS